MPGPEQDQPGYVYQKNFFQGLQNQGQALEQRYQHIMEGYWWFVVFLFLYKGHLCTVHHYL
jgi:hypothetical protein